jgi:hypothetical protein
MLTLTYVVLLTITVVGSHRSPIQHGSVFTAKPHLSTLYTPRLFKVLYTYSHTGSQNTARVKTKKRLTAII